MSSTELRTALTRQPFQPFRLVMTDGAGYNIRHPDLVWVGLTSAIVGVSQDEAGADYTRTVHVDLLHVIRLEMQPGAVPTASNGEGV